MIPPSKYRGYSVFAAHGISSGKSRLLIDTALALKAQPIQIFKDNHRTYSAVYELDGDSVMLKIPRGRNLRTWERILTLFRKSEGVRTFHNLEFMNRLGLNAPRPLVAAEKRRLGVVVDSFICYLFEEGQPAGSEDARDVVTRLIELHETGYLRTDPQAANFLVTNRGIVFIDFRLKKPVLFPDLRKNLELAKLARVFPASALYIPRAIAASTLFKFSKWLELQTFRLRQAKRQLKQKLR